MWIAHKIYCRFLGTVYSEASTFIDRYTNAIVSLTAEINNILIQEEYLFSCIYTLYASDIL